MNPLLDRSDMARDIKGDHTVLPATHALTNHTCLYSPAAEHRCLLAGTHCAYPWRDGQAELTCMDIGHSGTRGTVELSVLYLAAPVSEWSFSYFRCSLLCILCYWCLCLCVWCVSFAARLDSFCTGLLIFYCSLLIVEERLLFSFRPSYFSS